MKTRTANWDHNQVALPCKKRVVTNNGGVCPQCGRDCYQENDPIIGLTVLCDDCGWMVVMEEQAAQERQEELDRQAEINFARYGGVQ